MANPQDSVSVERVIAAPPERIFDLLADPARHADFDGSGSVKSSAAGSPERLELGAKFAMSMQRGVKYSMLNTVTEFEENRRIAWSPKPPSGRGSRWVGRIWRYELEPVDGGTKVTETWDISKEGLRFVLRYIATGGTQKAMEKSLQQLDALVTGH
ncbi:MAG: SRPBCC family protein [Acidimicrobiales bacterium]